MRTSNFLMPACRYCRYYNPEGRRGGMCQLLGVQVQGSWKACALALPAFAPSWEGLVCAGENSSLTHLEEMASSTLESKKAEPLLV